MRRLFYICLLFAGIATLTEAQNPTVPRISRGSDRTRQPQQQKENGPSELSVRAQIMNEQLVQNLDNARWMRVIYRKIDLTKEKNGSLYYPVQEINGQMNLFTTLFHLVKDGKIQVYRYLGDYESFGEDNALSFKDLLEKFNIYYDSVPASGGRQAMYVINASDIPSSEVKTYYVKEAWYFDQNNSLYDVKTLAICPIAHVTSDMGAEQTLPMFWTKYEDIRPYIKNTLIMTSNINNAKTYTYDDYFRQRMFDGEIIKTENMLNEPLQKIYPNPDSLLMAQQQIEQQLASFNNSLWVQPDTATAVSGKKEAKKLARTTRKPEKGVSNNDKSAGKEKAPKAEKPSPAKSTPVRGIRRR